jgi:Tol biopolymer transport system component
VDRKPPAVSPAKREIEPEVKAAGPAPAAAPAVTTVSAPEEAPAEAPAPLRGKILFLSDRFGEVRLMVMDPVTRKVGQVTQSWVYAAEQARMQSAAGVQVSVASRPCGSGATPVVEGGVTRAPGDPARQCAQLVVTEAGGQPHEVTPAGYVHYDPAVSPDGQWIAYVSQITGGDEVFKIRVNGQDNTRLTENIWEWDKHPSWSPDGGRIVFWSNRGGPKQLFVMNADGSAVQNLSQNTYNDWDPVWVR